MKILIIGFGSIGQKHFKILSSLSHEVAVVSNRKIYSTLYYKELKDSLIIFKPDYIVIANRTSEHFKTLKALVELNFKGKILIEKPIFECKYEIPENNFSTIGIGYNLRFHPLILKLKNLLCTKDKIISASLYVGSYLPNWRTTSDYRESYSAKKIQGGGVLRDLSHELDIALWLFGDWINLTSLGGKLSNLEIDSEDAFSILMETKKCKLVNITMNYFDRMPKREIIVNTESSSFVLDLINNNFTVNSIGEHIQYDLNETYISEHYAVINGDEDIICTPVEALKTVSLIEAAEISSKNRNWVNNYL